MWVAKIKYSAKGTLIGTKTQKHKVTMFAFPLSYSYEKDWVIVQITGTLFGKDADKKKFAEELRKEPRTINFELNDDFFIGTIKEPSYTKYAYNKDIIYVAPALISDQGYEIITIGSFQKEPLSRVIAILKNKYNGQLLSIQQTKLKSISIMKVHPDITKKQKQAMDLAIKQGYYNSPRKIDLQQLAKIAKLSFSTYQVHLRKAEQKIIPYFFE